MDMPQTQSQYFPLLGGLDVETAQFAKAPGLVIRGVNLENSQESGYERIGGFERFDGRPRPSDATFLVLRASVAFTGVSVGDTISGATSTATAHVIEVRTASQLVVTRVTGTFTPGENILVGVGVVGVYYRESDDVTSSNFNVYAALAAEDYRVDIGVVPGSGPIRGIATLNDVVYAWRDNAGATACEIYKSTAGGWTLVPLLREVSFTVGGGTPPAEGATITKGAVTAVVKRVVLQSGTWASTTAAGRIIVTSVAGGAFTAGAFTAGITATCSGADTAITLLPGGRLDLINYNFTGSTATERIYGADGVNRGFEFDGTVLVPISTGMTTDKPSHVAAHMNHLFFAFKASVQNSGIGAPYNWTVISGAAEISVGQDVTGFSNLPGQVDSAPLMIFSSTRTTVIFGTSAADWKMTTYSASIGAQRWSVQNIGNPVVCNSLGIAPVVQSSEFGNFTMPISSDRVRSYLDGKTVTASVVNRSLNHMRLFFSDGSGLSITPVGNKLRFLPISYDSKVINCACEAMISNVSRSFFGSTDGYVYEADVGRSFDGEPIEAWLKLAFNHNKAPTIRKRFRKVSIEVAAQSATSLMLQADYSLGQINATQSAISSTDVVGDSSLYDLSNWDQAYYDSSEQTTSGVRLDGIGTNISLTIYSKSANALPYVLQSVTTAYTLRRIER